MKKLMMIGGVLAAAWAGSCSNDSEEELFEQPDCTQPVSLGADVMPILQSNCAVEFCHVSGTGLPDFREKENVLANAVAIKSMIRNGSMPPPSSGITLSSDDIDKISCWVDQGGKDN